MAYFSSKSTWLSLVEGTEAWANGDGSPLSLQDYRPGIPFPGAAETSPGLREEEADAHDFDAPADPEQLRLTRELRHRLFFQHREWEFGPALLGDLLALAKSESDAEEALAYYCQARHVAKTLVEECDRPEYLSSWLETDRVIAELHHLRGNFDSCAMYAREGLETIKKNKFAPEMDMRITRLAIRFFQLLGRH